LRPNEKKGGEKFAVWEYKCDQVSQRKKRRKTETKSGRKVGRKVVTFGGRKVGPNGIRFGGEIIKNNGLLSIRRGVFFSFRLRIENRGPNWKSLKITDFFQSEGAFFSVSARDFVVWGGIFCVGRSNSIRALTL